MRRSTPRCEEVAIRQRALLGTIASLAPETVARMVEDLAPFAREERRTRLRSVIDARLDSVTVVLDSPYDPHNGAAVLRSCDAFGVQRLHVVEKRPFLSARQVSRGSERWVDVVTHASHAAAVADLGARGFELVATHPEGDLLPSDLARRGRVAIVVGNEQRGIAPGLGAACAARVRVPMRGFAESLNLSVTAAILLEHATRGRPGDLGEDEKARLYLRALVFTLPHAPEILAAKGHPTLDVSELGC